MASTYVTKINNIPLAASEVVAGSPLASKIASLVSGSFKVVSLNESGKPDVANPSTKIIYLTKSSEAGLTDPYTEWIYTGTDGEAAVASKWEIIGETSINLSGYKTKQTAKTDPSASGTTITAIDTITQNENGEITATKKTIRSGTTSQTGVVQLEDSVTSTSTTKAATPNSVKEAYDLADTAVQGIILGGNNTELAKNTDKKVVIPPVTTEGEGEYGLMSPGDKEALDTLTTAALSGVKIGSVTAPVANNVATLSADGTYSTTNKLATVSTVTSAINALDVTEIGGSNTYIKSISEANGLVSATTATFPTIPAAANNGVLQVKINNGTATNKFSADQSTNSTLSFATGTTNGTIKVDSTEVPVAGLKSAAYTESGAYATSAQGAKADSALSGVKVNNTALTVTNNTVNIPLATTAASGVVILTTAEI